MSRFKPRWQYSSDEDRLEINVIPLIDILLVVLIFITATTTFSTIEQLELKLPGGKQETIASQGNILLITHEGQYALNGRVLASDDESLAQAMRNLEDKNELLIYADADARHAAVVRALEAANKAQLERIHFATERQTE
ncbi:MAG TPA: biopolymer transporter ExbD [Paenalcaligenes sp.]|nr:biopolymer transporter ExbD [Paenalcaligenes sp.]